jgi:hypothetical protein
MDAGKFGIVHTGMFHRTGYLTLFAACAIYGIYFYFFAGHGSLTGLNLLVGWPYGHIRGALQRKIVQYNEHNHLVCSNNLTGVMVGVKQFF